MKARRSNVKPTDADIAEKLYSEHYKQFSADQRRDLYHQALSELQKDLKELDPINPDHQLQVLTRITKLAHYGILFKDDLIDPIFGLQVSTSRDDLLERAVRLAHTDNSRWPIPSNMQSWVNSHKECLTKFEHTMFRYKVSFDHAINICKVKGKSEEERNKISSALSSNERNQLGDALRAKQMSKDIIEFLRNRDVVQKESVLLDKVIAQKDMGANIGELTSKLLTVDFNEFHKEKKAALNTSNITDFQLTKAQEQKIQVGFIYSFHFLACIAAKAFLELGKQAYAGNIHMVDSLTAFNSPLECFNRIEKSYRSKFTNIPEEVSVSLSSNFHMVTCFKYIEKVSARYNTNFIIAAAFWAVKSYLKVDLDYHYYQRPHEDTPVTQPNLCGFFSRSDQVTLDKVKSTLKYLQIDEDFAVKLMPMFAEKAAASQLRHLYRTRKEEGYSSEKFVAESKRLMKI